MKKKKSKKKLVIGVGILVVAVVAGVNIYGSMNAADSAIPQVKTVSAVRDNVQQTVEINRKHIFLLSMPKLIQLR